MAGFQKSGSTRKQDRQRRYGRANRCLAKILARLYAGERLSMKKMAEECAVSLRTMQRYVYERLAEFPIQNDGGCFFLEKGPLGLDEQEAFEMLGFLGRAQGATFYAMVSKALGQRVADADNSCFVSDSTQDLGRILGTIADLRVAIKECRYIACRYQKSDSRFWVRLKPLKIVCFGGKWYLAAQDQKSAKIKKYILERE